MTEGRAHVLLLDLLDGITPLRIEGDPAVDVQTVEYDSRRVGPGACFACVPGLHTDGHVHAPAAVAAGAVALLVERPLGLGVTEARVPEVRRVLGPVAARMAGDPSHALRCVGVTGTNGKTTTTYLLYAIATAAGTPAGLIGTTGARIGRDALDAVDLGFTTPEAPDLQRLLATMRDERVEMVAMEVSSHALDQHRVDGTRFAAACFTNLSHDHLDYHRTLEAYFEAKARLFAPELSDLAVTNLDDPHGREIARRAAGSGLPVFTYARDDATADFGVEVVGYGLAGTDLVLEDRRAGERVAITVGLLGPVNVANVLAAAATARALGVPFAAVARGCASVSVVPGRLERVDAGQPFSVLVDYAHTPEALAHAVAAARVLAGAGRVAVVFGCGGDRDTDKRVPMGTAASAADLVVVTSDNPRSEDPARIATAAARGVRDAGGSPVVELDRRSAIATALDWAAPGDVVLVAGKGHESTQTVAGVTLPFDDRVVVRELLEAAPCR
ncbi:MAG: UDP-N-acetylmuramoyl-L-alanyl-D-glutamate--2,6-diaminopimelate ligase [Actinomycetota bacterium]